MTAVVYLTIRCFLMKFLKHRTCNAIYSSSFSICECLCGLIGTCTEKVSFKKSPILIIREINQYELLRTFSTRDYTSVKI